MIFLKYIQGYKCKYKRNKIILVFKVKYRESKNVLDKTIQMFSKFYN